MGAFTFSIDVQLVECLKRVLPLTVFVETGTFEGASVRAVLSLFEEIFTVEFSDEYFLKARDRLRDHKHVHCESGNSPPFLAGLRERLKDKSVLYWLDAHWCSAPETAGFESQCPLIQELRAIGSLNAHSAILMDDARYFLSPPPKPHQISQWPSFQAIWIALSSLSPLHQLTVINDVLIFHPTSIYDAMADYAQEHGIDLLHLNTGPEAYQLLRTRCEQLGKDLTARDQMIAFFADAAAKRLEIIHALEARLDRWKPWRWRAWPWRRRAS
jgi:hypothetical protein